MMIETCLKCGHVNNASTGDDTEACPQCGAIYSKVEMAMATKQRPQAKERSKQFWTYTVLIGLLTVLVPLTVYEHTWGSSAKRRKSEASLNVALADQRIQEQEAIAKAMRGAIDQAVSQGRVVVGMTAAQTREAWGNPSSINRTENAYGASEQWVYGIGDYVYLSNDVVQSVQTSRKQR